MIDQVKQRQQRSVRRCCQVLGLRRTTYHRRKAGYHPEQADDSLAAVLRSTAAANISWGFWKIFDYLRYHNIIQDNHKRVYPIWCREKLNLRVPPKRQRIYRTYKALMSPGQINEGWAMDFVSDWVAGPTRKQVRVINIMDEGSRRALWAEAHQSISAKKLVNVLDQVVACRGKPAYIRCDNGPEFISKKPKAWAQQNGIELRFIQPGKPSQNGLIERLNKTLRRECLDLTWYHSMSKLNDAIQIWSQTYNLERPHDNLGKIPPDKYEQLNQKFYYSVVTA
ncbi:MAG: IS3 family transposase [Mameliella sp.]|nr:IS3 family transposase [Phaeodactylibacter sp.]